jgi:hypothetical protein
MLSVLPVIRKKAIFFPAASRRKSRKKQPWW